MKEEIVGLIHWRYNKEESTSQGTCELWLQSELNSPSINPQDTNTFAVQIAELYEWCIWICEIACLWKETESSVSVNSMCVSCHSLSLNTLCRQIAPKARSLSKFNRRELERALVLKEYACMVASHFSLLFIAQ